MCTEGSNKDRVIIDLFFELILNDLKPWYPGGDSKAVEIETLIIAI